MRVQVVRGYLARKEVARISKDRLSKHDYDVRRRVVPCAHITFGSTAGAIIVIALYMRSPTAALYSVYLRVSYVDSSPPHWT
jgi:hypothetical protein